MQAILILLLFQLAGEVAVRMLHLPLSGGIMGMVLFFSSKFLQHLALYLLPVSAGVITLWPLLQKEGVVIVLVMVLSTIIPLLVCAWCLDKLLSKKRLG